MNPREDLGGKTFGLLTVIGRTGKAPSGQTLYAYECKCGARGVMRHDQIKRGYHGWCPLREAEKRDRHMTLVAEERARRLAGGDKKKPE